MLEMAAAGVPVDLQTKLFAFFSDTVDVVKHSMMREGYTEGIVDVAGESFEIVAKEKIYEDTQSKACLTITHYFSRRGVLFAFRSAPVHCFQSDHYLPTTWVVPPSHHMGSATFPPHG
jgi:hypothetical protein